jgi:hypothetical protein
MSIVGGYSNLSAAGSRLKRWMFRPRDWAWVMIELQKVDLPEPAGPVHNNRKKRRGRGRGGSWSAGGKEGRLKGEESKGEGGRDIPVTRIAYRIEYTVGPGK